MAQRQSGSASRPATSARFTKYQLCAFTPFDGPFLMCMKSSLFSLRPSGALRVRYGAVLLFLGALTAIPTVAHAQLSRADSASVLLRTARDFDANGDSDTAEALLVYLTQRFGDTAAGAAALDLLTGPDGQRVDRVSRIELPVFSTLYGLWLGVAVPAAFGADEPEAYGAGLLIGGPLGLFSGLSAVKSRRISEGQARAISWGGVWGTWQGFGWGHLLDIGADEFCDINGCYPANQSDDAIFASMVVGGLAGIGGGVLLARNPIESGVSSAAQGGSIWGTVYGAMVAELVDDDNGGGDDAVLATSLIAGNVGLVAGALLASRHDVGRPRVRIINLGALVGGVGGLGIDLLVQPNDDALITIPLITSVAGLIIATYATRDDDRVGAGQPPENGALFGWADGGLRLQTPIPTPTLLEMPDENGRPTWTPGLRLELFSTRF